MKNKLFTILIGLAMVAAILPAYTSKGGGNGTQTLHMRCTAYRKRRPCKRYADRVFYKIVYERRKTYDG